MRRRAPVTVICILLVTALVPPRALGQSCGDAVLDPGEACDDGNAVADDGCEPDCTLTPHRLIPGRRLFVRDVAGDPSQRLFRFLSHGPGFILPAPGSSGDPTLYGATIRLARGVAEVDTFTLPPSGWSGFGSPPGARGYRYRDPTQTNGPCKKAGFQTHLLHVSCAGSQIGFTLDEPAQGALAISVAPGTSGLRSCIEFGGTIFSDEPATPAQVGIFWAKYAPAPAACPLP